MSTIGSIVDASHLAHTFDGTAPVDVTCARYGIDEGRHPISMSPAEESHEEGKSPRDDRRGSSDGVSVHRAHESGADSMEERPAKPV